MLYKDISFMIPADAVYVTLVKYINQLRTSKWLINLKLLKKINYIVYLKIKILCITRKVINLNGFIQSLNEL